MIRKIMNYLTSNILYIIGLTVVYYLILFNIILSISFMIGSIYVLNIYKLKKHKFQNKKKLDFQINNFIKNMAINSLTNNFNIIDSVEKSSVFVEGKLKKDLEQLSDEIKIDFNYEKAFDNLSSKYSDNKILKEFLTNVLIIKEQSNVDESAKKVFEAASKDSQKFIVTQDRISKIKESNFKNYLINVCLGFFVIILIVFSLNTYYVAFAKTLEGIILNSSTILLTLFITIKFINQVFQGETHEN